MTGSGPPDRGACPGPDPRGQAERRAFAFEVVSPGVLEGVVVPYGVPIRIGGAPGGAGRAGVRRGLGAPIWALRAWYFAPSGIALKCGVATALQCGGAL